MESYSFVEEENKKMKTDIEEPLLISQYNNKGGFRTLPFIIANEAFEKVASAGMTPNMIVYFVKEYHMDMAFGTNILNFYSSACYFTPLVGALLADSCIGRFSSIAFGSIISLLGMILLWSTAMFPGARPPPCDMDHSNSCSMPTTSQLVLLCFSFVLMAIGAGGIRAASMAFGADQIDKREDETNNANENAGTMTNYISWYNAASGLPGIVGITLFAYFQEHYGWKIGFGIPVGCMLVSALSFFLASTLYIKMKGNSSLLIGLVQVIVASYKNRHRILSSERDNTLFYHYEGSSQVVPTENLRFLSKACVMEDPKQELNSDGRASNPWRLCTVDQVEELKALLNIIPMWSTGILFSINSSQGSFSTIQVKTMDRHLTSSFEIPMGSFGIFTILSVVILVFSYPYIILPTLSRIMGRRVYFSAKERTGCGFFLSILAMVYAAIMESIRREIAIKEGYGNDPNAVINLSAFWTLPSSILNGFADALVIIALLEFYFSEFPKSMSSIAATISGLANSVGNLLASLIVSIVDQVTRRGGKVSWISSNINQAHYDYYYWLLAGLSFLNFIYFLVVCWGWYPSEGKRKCVKDEIGRKWNPCGSISGTALQHED